MSGTDDERLMVAVAAHRREFAALLGGLTGEAWDRPSLCAGWRVRDVVAHMVMPFRYSTRRFVAELARARGNFDVMADRVARRDGSVPTEELLAVLHENEHTVWKPPGGGLVGALTHDVLHGQDITVPLGVHHPVPEDSLRVVLGGVASARSRKHFHVNLDGIQLRAEDIDWSFGSGAALSGAAQDLALVLCGRKLPAGRLRGAASARFTVTGGHSIHEAEGNDSA